MPRLLFFSDSHLGFDLPVRPRVARRRRGEDFFAMLDHVLEQAVHRRVDAVVHGGDVFFRSKIPPSIVDRVYARWLSFVTTHDLPLFLVPGNHERSRLPSSLLLVHPRIHVFDRPRSFSLDVGDARVALSGFPFVRDVRAPFSTIARALRADAPGADVSLLCMHHAVQGATVGPRDFTFSDGPDVVRARDLAVGFDAVLSGHIHRRQVLWFDDVPVIYAGSIERTAFVEKDEPKGFFVIELAGHASNPAKLRAHDLRFVRLPARDMFELASDDRDELTHLLEGLPSDAVVRVSTSLPAFALRACAPPTMTITPRAAAARSSSARSSSARAPSARPTDLLSFRRVTASA
jgi:DNA repair exonuclease SbcCD nuclease subunit